MKILKISILLASIFCLSACDRNPLIGSWKVKPGQNTLMVLCPELTFTKNMSKCGGFVEEVEYEIQGNLVVVSSEFGDALGMKLAYEVPDNNTMILELPMVGKIVYGRSSY